MGKLNVMSEIEKSMANMRNLTDELNKQVQSNWARLVSVCLGEDSTQAKQATTPKPRIIKKRAKKKIKLSLPVVEQNITTTTDSSSVQTELANDAELNTAPKTDITPTIPALS